MSKQETSAAIPDWYPLSPHEERADVVATVGQELATLLAGIKLVVLDADGILTTGDLLYGPRGEAMKAFNVQDGLGLVLARVAGLKRAVLTGRDSTIVGRRCGELHFEAIKLGRFDKAVALAEILAETCCESDQVLYMGDDLIDLPALVGVALPVTVPAAPQVVREACRYVTVASGGRGAVREIMDLLLKSRGELGLALGRLGDPRWGPAKTDLSSDETG